MKDNNEKISFLESSKKLKENFTKTVVPFTKEKFNDVKEFASDKAIPVINSSLTTTKDKLVDIKDKTTEMIKSNITEEEMANILKTLYIKSIDGIPKISVPVNDLVNDYLSKNSTIDAAAKSLIKNSMIKCGTSGFLTGFGGLTTLFATIPANITSVMYVQLRMCCAIASMAGYDIHSDQVQTLIYACLTGSAMADILKQAGIKFGNKFGIAMIKKIPGSTLTIINRKVGFRFITKFGEQGIINLHKVVPVLGGAIGGGIDIASTKTIGYNAYNLFIKEELPDDILDASIDIEGIEVSDDIDDKMLNEAINNN